jgi:Conserved mid region of cactin
MPSPRLQAPALRSGLIVHLHRNTAALTWCACACREQNEYDFAQRQEDIGDLERRRLAAEAVKEAAKEEQFHLNQSIDRARKRLNEDRAHPIDELIRVLHLQESHPIEDVEWRPYNVFEHMRLEEVQALLEHAAIFKARRLCWRLRRGAVARVLPCSGQRRLPRTTRLSDSLLDVTLACSSRIRFHIQYLASLQKKQARHCMQTIDVEQPGHGDYWHALSSLMQQQVDAELAAERADRAVVRRADRADRSAAAANGSAAAAAAAAKPANAAVEGMVAEALGGSQEELAELEEYVEQELAAPGCPDPEFWQSIKPRCALQGAQHALAHVHTGVCLH